jgi:hypothetical protein
MKTGRAMANLGTGQAKEEEEDGGSKKQRSRVVDAGKLLASREVCVHVVLLTVVRRYGHQDSDTGY